MYTLALALAKLIDFITWMIVIEAIMSWFPNKGPSGQKIQETLQGLTSIFIEPVRAILARFNTGPLDFSPLVVILLLNFIKRLLINLII